MIFPNALVPSVDDPSQPATLVMETEPNRPVIWRTQRLGDSEGNVPALQFLLSLPITSTFDPATLAAVTAFQAANVNRKGLPLAPDGVVGMDTWQALVSR